MPEVVLLTQEQVALRLHRSVATVERLRRSGALAFLPGRPVLIPEHALNEYIEKTLVQPSDVTRSEKSAIKSANNLTVDRRSKEDREYDEVGLIFEELERRTGGQIELTPEVKNLLKRIENHPKIIEAHRQAEIDILMYSQGVSRRAKKAAARSPSKAAKRRAAGEQRRQAVAERQAKKAALTKPQDQPKTS